VTRARSGVQHAVARYSREQVNGESTVLRDLLILVSGLALVLVASNQVLAGTGSAASALAAIGFAMAGYAPIRLVLHSAEIVRDRRTGRSIDRLFQSAVRIVEPNLDLPLFIAADIEGCITPANRGEVDLRRFQRLRGYSEFVKRNPEYPQLVIFSGRSQGYVELLAQALGMLNSPLDLPFVIENGSALYLPTSKRTVSLLTPHQLHTLQQARTHVMSSLTENEFEPKYQMVTVNPKDEHQTIDELRDAVNDVLRAAGILDDLVVTSTASAVDVTVRGVDKLSGLQEVLKYYPGDKPHVDLGRVVAIADHLSDRRIVQNVGSAYCPAESVHPEIRELVVNRFGSDHVINAPCTDFVSMVIERECGVRIV